MIETVRIEQFNIINNLIQRFKEKYLTHGCFN